jgi:hypothetical protein
MDLRYRYDFMRFPEQGSQDFELVVRSHDRSYDIYTLEIQIYPDVATLFHRAIDLSQYTAEELDEWVAHWGYADYGAFMDYLEKKTVVGNHELRLCSCITQNDLFLEPTVAISGDLDACIDFLTARLGKSPYDDSDEEEADTPGADTSACRC